MMATSKYKKVNSSNIRIAQIPHIWMRTSEINLLQKIVKRGRLRSYHRLKNVYIHLKPANSGVGLFIARMKLGRFKLFFCRSPA